MEANLIFTVKSPHSQAILKEAGPEEYISLKTSNNPLSMVILDETRPLFIYNLNQGPVEPQFITVYLLMAV